MKRRRSQRERELSGEEHCVRVVGGQHEEVAVRNGGVPAVRERREEGVHQVVQQVGGAQVRQRGALRKEAPGQTSPTAWSGDGGQPSQAGAGTAFSEGARPHSRWVSGPRPPRRRRHRRAGRGRARAAARPRATRPRRASRQRPAASVAEVWPRCGRGVAEVWPRCGRGVAEVRPPAGDLQERRREAVVVVVQRVA